MFGHLRFARGHAARRLLVWPRRLHTCGFIHHFGLHAILRLCLVVVHDVGVHEGYWDRRLRVEWVEVEGWGGGKATRPYWAIERTFINLLSLYFHWKWIKVLDIASCRAIYSFIYRRFGARDWAHEVETKCRKLLIYLINIILKILYAVSFTYWWSEITYVMSANFTFRFVIQRWLLSWTGRLLHLQCTQINGSNCILLSSIHEPTKRMLIISLLLYESLDLLLELTAFGVAFSLSAQSFF